MSGKWQSCTGAKQGYSQPGPQAGESFCLRTTPALLRRFVAIAPRGVTLEFVSDRTTNILQESVRMLLDPDKRGEVLKAADSSRVACQRPAVYVRDRRDLRQHSV